MFFWPLAPLGSRERSSRLVSDKIWARIQKRPSRCWLGLKVQCRDWAEIRLRPEFDIDLRLIGRFAQFA